MKSHIFRKEFTRDNGLIVQEVWDKAHMVDIDGNPNPILPTQITYITDGVAEIWNNEESVQWFKDRLLQKHINDPDFFWNKIKEYDKQFKELQKYWYREHLQSIEELQEFVKLVSQATYNFLIFYYPSYDDRTPQEIRAKALEMRKNDTFYDDTNRLTANTLSHLYPEVKGYEISFLEEDLYSIPSLEVLKKRFKNFIYITDQTSEIISLEKFLNRHKEYKFIFDKVEDYNQVRGEIAYKGNVKGEVKILKRKNQISEFKEGQILVSPMTTPDFLPAMKKASAFVTDEGGMMCHAAIIARELKIPCVTGTRVATQVFKDGDIVEVDANIGIVRKI